MAHLTSLSYLVEDAVRKGYAVPQININNLEWIQAVLLAAQADRAPVILGVSAGAKKYIGSYRLVTQMVLALMDEYHIEVPVCLHLDHGSLADVHAAIDAGFNSVMFDGSRLPFAENLALATQISQKCRAYGIGLEVELGAIGGVEDGQVSAGERANVDECVTMSRTVPMDLLAASIGNIHGVYPADWRGLDFDLLQKIAMATNLPLVLHGGSGIDDHQVEKAIALGIRKINVNTECQIGFTRAMMDYLALHHDLNDKKAYDPRNYLRAGMEGIKQVCHEKFVLFGANNRY